MNMIDARGLSCPMPVMMVQKAVKSAPAELEVLLDSQTALLNVTRFAEGQGYAVTVKEDGEDFHLTLKK